MPRFKIDVLKAFLGKVHVLSVREEASQTGKQTRKPPMRSLHKCIIFAVSSSQARNSAYTVCMAM